MKGIVPRMAPSIKEILKSPPDAKSKSQRLGIPHLTSILSIYSLYNKDTEIVFR